MPTAAGLRRAVAATVIQNAAKTTGHTSVSNHPRAAQVAVDDQLDIAFVDTAPVEFVDDRRRLVRVERVDELVAETDARVDDDHAVGVVDHERVHRKRREGLVLRMELLDADDARELQHIDARCANEPGHRHVLPPMPTRGSGDLDGALELGGDLLG